MENLRRVYGLDRPLIAQFGSYLAALARGDLGPSFSFRDQSVLDLIARGLPVSATLGALALALATALGVGSRHRGGAPAGRRDRPRSSGIGAALTLSLPSFVVAPLLQIAFGLTPPLAAARRLERRRPEPSCPAGRHPGACRRSAPWPG